MKKYLCLENIFKPPALQKATIVSFCNAEVFVWICMDLYGNEMSGILKTYGMVENFNKKIKNNVLKKYLFSSIFEMEEKIIKFVNEYNFEKKLKSLNYKTPEQFLKEKKGFNNIIQCIVI